VARNTRNLASTYSYSSEMVDRCTSGHKKYKQACHQLLLQFDAIPSDGNSPTCCFSPTKSCSKIASLCICQIYYLRVRLFNK